MVRIDIKNMDLYNLLVSLIMISRNYAEGKFVIGHFDKTQLENFLDIVKNEVEKQVRNYQAYTQAIKTIQSNLNGGKPEW